MGDSGCADGRHAGECVAELSRLISAGAEREGVVEAAARALYAITGWAAGALYLVDETGRFLQLENATRRGCGKDVPPTIPGPPAYAGSKVTLECGSELVGLFVGGGSNAEPFEPSGEMESLLSVVSALIHLYGRRAALENQVKAAQRLIHVQNQLLDEVVENRPLRQIVSSLARETGRAVVLEDRLLRPLAVAEPGIAAGGSPDLLAAAGGTKRSPALKAFLQTLVRTGLPERPPVQVGAIAGNRLMIAVVGQSQHLGYLSLLEGDQPFDQTDQMVIRIGANAVGLKMLYDKIAFDVEENIKQDFLCNVVTNNYSTEQAIIEKANYLGYNITLPFNVIVMVWSDPKRENVEVIPGPLLNYVKHKLKGWSPRSIVSSFRSVELFVLADAQGDMSAHEIAARIAELVREQIQSPFFAGIGKLAQRPQEIKRSFVQAREIVGIMQQMNRLNCIETYENLGAYSVLLGVKSVSELEGFSTEILGPLIKYDGEKNGDLLHTLATYLLEKGSHEEIARKLHVHVNTLKYRIQKIQDILGVSLDEPEERFSVQLAIKALQVSKACRNWG